MTGVAKTGFRTATHAIPVLRGNSTRPVFVTAASCAAPTRRSWCGSWRAGSGYRTRCDASIGSPARGRRQFSSGATTRAIDARNAACECTRSGSEECSRTGPDMGASSAANNGGEGWRPVELCALAAPR